MTFRPVALGALLFVACGHVSRELPGASSATEALEAPHREARALLREREFLRAAELLDRTVRESEDDLEARRLLGRALLAQGAPDFAEHELEWAALEEGDLVATREYLSAVAAVDGVPRRALYTALLYGAAAEDEEARLAAWVWLATFGQDPGPAPRPKDGSWPSPLAEVLEGKHDPGALLEELSADADGARRAFVHYLLGEAALCGLGPWAAGADVKAARAHFQAALRAGKWSDEGYALAAFLLDRT